MPIIIDTYNCMHAGRMMGGAASDLTVATLCRYLQGLPGKITLVLDGRPKPEEPDFNAFPNLVLRYSGVGVEADKVIGQMVEQSKSRKSIVVVTNDRAVASHARQRHARVRSCEEFLALLINPSEKSRKGRGEASEKTGAKLPSGVVDYWVRQFDLLDARDD